MHSSSRMIRETDSLVIALGKAQMTDEAPGVQDIVPSNALKTTHKR